MTAQTLELPSKTKLRRSPRKASSASVLTIAQLSLDDFCNFSSRRLWSAERACRLVWRRGHDYDGTHKPWCRSYEHGAIIASIIGRIPSDEIAIAVKETT
jgi:hypothetical protein